MALGARRSQLAGHRTAGGEAEWPGRSRAAGARWLPAGLAGSTTVMDSEGQAVRGGTYAHRLAEGPGGEARTLPWGLKETQKT
jgi:hypothetical protein